MRAYMCNRRALILFVVLVHLKVMCLKSKHTFAAEMPEERSEWIANIRKLFSGEPEPGVTCECVSPSDSVCACVCVCVCVCVCLFVSCVHMDMLFVFVYMYVYLCLHVHQTVQMKVFPSFSSSDEFRVTIQSNESSKRYRLSGNYILRVSDTNLTLYSATGLIQTSFKLTLSDIKRLQQCSLVDKNGLKEDILVIYSMP